MAWLLCDLFLLDVSSRTLHHGRKLCVLTDDLIHTEISVSRSCVLNCHMMGPPASQAFLCGSVAVCACGIVFEQSFGQRIAFICFNEYLPIYLKMENGFLINCLVLAKKKKKREV